MAYNLEKMSSLDGLKKISRVIAYLAAKVEIGGFSSSLILEENTPIPEVDKQDFEDIIFLLIKEKILKNKETIWHEVIKRDNDEFVEDTNGTSYGIKINYDELKKFGEELDTRIEEIKLTPPSWYKSVVKRISGVAFDEDEGVLTIGNYSIYIDQKNKKTFAHEILSFLRGNLWQEADYFEIAKSVEKMARDDNDFKDKYYKDKYYLRIYRACKDIQEKIQKQTNSKIVDFLEFDSKQTGGIKINKKYL